MVLDSNILIEAAKPGGERLAPYLAHPEACISIVSRIEALGYHLLKDEEDAVIRQSLAGLPELGLDAEIAERAIALRRQRRMKLGDAMIAGTALEYEVPLVTRNEHDFKHITGLRLINPFAEPDGT